MKADLDHQSSVKMLPSVGKLQKLASSLGFFQNSGQICVSAATCAPDLPVACAVQELEKSRGSPITTSSEEPDWRRTSWKIKAMRSALLTWLATDKADCSGPQKIPAQRWPQCAGLIARRAVPSLRQMRPAKNFWSGRNTTSGKTISDPPAFKCSRAALREVRLV